MSFKQSENSVTKNAKIWVKNLVPFEKSKTKRRKIPNIENSISELCKIPKQIIIIGRFNALAKEEKIRINRYKIMSNELIDLWSKLNFPTIAKSSVERKITKLIENYERFLKYSDGKDILSTFDKIFDITNEKGLWLSTEDKNLYHLQKNSKGEVGYTTTRSIPVHPSKAKLLQQKQPSTSCCQEIETYSESTSIVDEEEESSYISDDNEDYQPPATLKTVRQSSTKSAVTLVSKANLSTKKAAKVCKQLAKSGINISTPSQPGIYKASIKSAELMEETYKKTLKNESWCLHFDGKKFDKKEIQVIVLKNESKEIRLAVLVLEDGKSLTIFNGIKETLDKFDLWNSIKMIVSDTTSVNTGKKHGVVILLQNYFKSIDLPLPQYVGCQHHVLDLLLRHVMDKLLEGKSTSPNISYNFVSELINTYDQLKENYKQNETRIKVINIKWRDDMQYLHELGEAFRYYVKKDEFPYINFKALPPLSNARWNSRAILAILAFILIPKYHDELFLVCKFICGPWYDIWFSDHCFHEDNFETLEQSLTQFEKAHACFIRHWVKEDSAIPNQQRSNICAERAIKVVKDIFSMCKTPRTLNLKYISSKN